ncbi:hypothetical protein [Kineosporia sp. NBRC 101731]|uniref:hypothetical protein n=1 Tax=Kineosporia sp. NBRC 101731 TaxID=3032199 RepID=UPI0024A1CBAD|nr:hypothetical protein [Kineosporia sp. NBRC 101731]GLY28916.1 hypothetical protein Kisp02_22810 [Kineosporia sp. NBRC 101731]
MANGRSKSRLRFLGIPAAAISLLLGTGALGSAGLGLLVTLVFATLTSIDQPSEPVGPGRRRG